MKLTLHTDFVDDDGNLKRHLTIKRNLPNKDGFHLFESWLDIKNCENIPYNIMDGIMEAIYEIIYSEAKISLGLSDKDFNEGKWGIEDPMVEDVNNMSAIVYIYV